jgi:F0F1-type ATP synthase membrane subunit b/b'
MNQTSKIKFMTKIFSYICLLLFITACSQAYYGALEKVGIHKRDIMVDRVQEAKQSQEDAKEQFQSALEEFSSVANFQGGDLEDTYKKLDKELQKSESRAKEVTTRIDSVEDVSIALFKEWEQELDLYESQKLRAQSEQQLKDTKVRY